MALVLSKVREMLLGLSPKDIFYQLKDIPEGQLKFSEYLLVKVYSLVEPFAQEARVTRLENSSLKEEIKFKNERLK